MLSFGGIGGTLGLVVLATLGQAWSLRHTPGHRVALQPLITLRPKYGMTMQLQSLSNHLGHGAA